MKLIEIVNQTTQTSVASLNKIALGNIDKSVCQCAYSYNGTDTLTLKQNGYYLVLFRADAEATAATQQMEVELTSNGSRTGVTATALGTAAGDTFTISLFKIVKIAGTPLALSVINSGTATTFNNAVLSVVKIA